VATLAVVVLVALYFGQPPPVAVTQPVVRLTLPVTSAAPLATPVPIVLSPDGKQLVYRIDGNPARLYIRPLDGFEARPLVGTEGGYHPFFSPDGSRVGFSADEKLKWVPITGGIPQTICDLPVAGWSNGGDWLPDGTILFSSQTLWRVAATGGTPQAVTALDEKKGEIGHFGRGFFVGRKRYSLPSRDSSWKAFTSPVLWSGWIAKADPRRCPRRRDSTTIRGCLPTTNVWPRASSMHVRRTCGPTISAATCRAA